ncbi:MAG: ornithine cyclodeaminase family protein [Bacteroidota bacterium]
MTLRLFTADDIRRILPMPVATDVMREAFSALYRGEVQVPPRVEVPVEAHHGVALVMPAASAAFGYMTVKLASVFRNNPALDLPTVHALVLAMDAATGVPVALVEGTYLTALRTAAASGVAMDLLAPTDANVGALFGTGATAHTHLDAMLAVRNLETVWVFGSSPEKAQAFVAARQRSVTAQLRAADAPERLAEADLVCTATSARTPVFADVHLKPGCHITAIGAFQPDAHEIPVQTVVRSRVVVDQREAALAEAGDLLIPIAHGRIDATHILAELGELLAAPRTLRAHPSDITLYKSVGLAVQDLAMVAALMEHAAGHAPLHTVAL